MTTLQTGSARQGAEVSPLAALERIRRAPREGPASSSRELLAEHCDLCSVEVGVEHGHLVDIEERRVMCSCRACYLLFFEQGAGGRRFRAVPDRCVALSQLELTQADWDALEIPVAVAFFFRNSVLGRIAACYPGPAGATETLLPLVAFEALEAREPLLDTLEADVEAVLVRHSRQASEAYIVPITACYELVGSLRQCWRGFDGGSDARAALESFFGRLRHRTGVKGA